jgi:hypothetical protein
MNVRDLIRCPLVHCVPMTDREWQRTLKRQRSKILGAGGRGRVHLNPKVCGYVPAGRRHG